MTTPVCNTVCGPAAPAVGGPQQFLGAKIQGEGQPVENDVNTFAEFDTVLLDSGGYADLAGDVIRIPAGRGGVYHVGLMVSWPDVESPQPNPYFGRSLILGSTVGFVLLVSDDAESPLNVGSTIVCLPDGEELGLSVLQDSGDTVNIAIAQLWAYRIGDCP